MSDNSDAEYEEDFDPAVEDIDADDLHDIDSDEDLEDIANRALSDTTERPKPTTGKKPAKVSDGNEDSDEEGSDADNADDDIDADDIDVDDVDADAAAAASIEAPPRDARRPPDIIREIVVVADDHRITSQLLSSFEMTEIVSIRATQISQFNNCMVSNEYDDPIKQAQLELMKRKCPLILIREVGERMVDGKLATHVEQWLPNTMTFAVHYDV